MQDFEYPNPKMKLIGKLFDPIMNFLIGLNISPMFFFVLILAVQIYFKTIRNRPKKKKYEFVEIVAISGLIIGFIIGILMQIKMIRKGGF